MAVKKLFLFGGSVLWAAVALAAETLPEWRIVAPEEMPEYEKAAVAD